jgi:pimeloyl-ACP methyl ester carboxylesterase
MKRRWKVLIGLLAALAVLLALNTIVLDQETKPAEVTVPGGRILSLNGGELEVLDLRPLPAAASQAEPPIVLLHCYTCGIDWWDRLIPLLRRGHRVIAIDLLGHDGSEKPTSGYSMPDQADLVAQALDRLGVRGATLVGHSTGGTVATALAGQSPELVSRLVLIDQAPDNSYGSLDLLARLTYWPVLGEALWRLSPDSAIKDGLSQAFAPGYDVPDRFVEDVRRMTYTSFDSTSSLEDDYLKQEPLNERIASYGIPLLVIFGAEDQIYDARESISAYAGVRGARTDLIEGAGHSPNVEKPAQVAKLVLAFAKPEFEPKPKQKPKQRVRTTTAKCQSATIGSGTPDWRKKSAVAGPLGLFGAGRDFSNATRIGPGTLQTKIPAFVAESRRTALVVPAAERGRIGLLWGHAAVAGNIRRIGDAFGRVVFAPCVDKPRTVWPGGLLLADRSPVTLTVISDRHRFRLRIG